MGFGVLVIMLERLKHLSMSKFRILVSLGQVIKRLGVVYSIPFPPLYLQALRWLTLVDFEFLFNFELMPMNCIMDSDYHIVVLFYTVAPLGIYGLLVLFFFLSSPC